MNFAAGDYYYMHAASSGNKLTTTSFLFLQGGPKLDLGVGLNTD